ncbi:hypothetical protein REPUB_Repub15cG0050800 [Reevesia pubescens]
MDPSKTTTGAEAGIPGDLSEQARTQAKVGTKVNRELVLGYPDNVQPNGSRYDPTQGTKKDLNKGGDALSTIRGISGTDMGDFVGENQEAFNAETRSQTKRANGPNNSMVSRPKPGGDAHWTRQESLGLNKLHEGGEDCDVMAYSPSPHRSSGTPLSGSEEKARSCEEGRFYSRKMQQGRWKRVARDTPLKSKTRYTCLKLEIPSTEPLFVKGTWFDTHFDLSVTDGLHAWVCNATEEEVKERAAQWDLPVTEYVELAEHYLGFQQPGSVYRFVDAGDYYKRLSWTFDKEGTKLEWRWKFQPSPDSRRITAGILDFLMDANISLSEEVVRKTQSFEKLKVEAEKCLELSERVTNEKMEFESEIYAKFLGVLNSKKAKLREFRDQLSKQETAGNALVYEEESTDKTESYHSGSDAEESEEPTKNLTSTSKDAPPSRGRGRKRATRK